MFVTISHKVGSVWRRFNKTMDSKSWAGTTLNRGGTKMNKRTQRKQESKVLVPEVMPDNDIRLRLSQEDIKLFQGLDRSGFRFVGYWNKGRVTTRKELEDAGVLPLK